METVTVGIPPGLAQVAPGPELGALLAGVDLGGVCDDDVLEVLAAADRQAGFERARLLAAVVETARRSSLAAGCEGGELDRYAADEVRAGLMLTPRGADILLEHAWRVMVGLPRLGAGMLAGELDESRARVFTRWTADVPEVLARRVCEKLVPKAAGWTTAQLAERIKRELLALDPQWARKRYEAALQGRDVDGYRDPEGTASLTGHHLPVDRVAAACDRLDRLAKSAKTAGDPRQIGHLRAELFLGMTDGTYVGCSDAEILAHLASTRPEDENDDDGPGPEDPEPGDPDPDDPGPDGPDPAGPDPGGADPDGPDLAGPEDIRRDCRPDGDDDLRPVDAQDLDAAAARRAAALAPARGGIELQVRLSTLLGADEAPGELPGWGPVHADLARTIAGRLTGAQWRWAITTDEGYLHAAGITTARPTGSTPAARRTGDVLELAIPATLLDQLTGPGGSQLTPALAAWLPVLTDIRRQLHTQAHRPPPDPRRRTPDAAQRREVQMALRRCVGVGCRRPARTSDIDHTIDHAHGGPTAGENLGPLCRRDHRLKHEGGWHLIRTGPHTFTWTSALGRTYLVHTPPVITACPKPDPTGQVPPQPWWLTSIDHQPWHLTTTWGAPHGPEPDPGPFPEPEPERPPDAYEVPPF